MLLVRARLDRTSAEGRQEVAGRGGGAGVGASAEWIDRVRVELIHPSTGSVVVESTAEVRVDPFRTDGEGPGPLLDRVLDDAVGGLDGEVGARSPPARSKRGGCSARPRAARVSRARCAGSAQLRLANPGLGEDEAARLMRRPSGVFIRAAEITTRLHAGDVVTAIDGMPGDARVAGSRPAGDPRGAARGRAGGGRGAARALALSRRVTEPSAEHQRARRGAPPPPARRAPEPERQRHHHRPQRRAGAGLEPHLADGEQQDQRACHAHHQRPAEAVDPQPRS